MEPLGPVRSTSLWNGPVEQAVGTWKFLKKHINISHFFLREVTHRGVLPEARCGIYGIQWKKSYLIIMWMKTLVV